MHRTSLLVRSASAAGITLCIGVASGCSAAAPDPDNLDFSFSYPATDNSPYAALAQQYMDAHPDITVTLDPIPSESYDKVLRTQMQGGNAADLIMAPPGGGSAISLLSLADAGLLAPLDSEAARALIPAASASLFTVDDQLYGQPTDISVTGTVFNETAGGEYPADVEKLLSTCESLPEGNSFFALAGSIPVNGGLAAVSIAATNVYAEEPDWDAKRATGDVTFSSTLGWRTTLQLILDLQSAGCFQPGAEGGGFDAIVNGLGQGKSLAAFIPGGAATDIAAGLGGQKLVVESFPPPAGTDPFVFASSDYALAISEASEHEAGAKAFLDWFAEPENAIAYAKLAGSLPVTGLEGMDLADSTYAPVADLIAQGRFAPLPVTVWQNPTVFDTLGTGVQALLTGQQTVDGLLTALDSAWDAE